MIELFAYPITPVPLQTLILSSDYIVIAKVEHIKRELTIARIDSLTGDTIWNGYFDERAKLHIVSMLKGKKELQQAIVTYSPNMICPSPARYPDGETVVAFINKDKESDLFYTNGLSYGSKVVSSEEELNHYKNSILSYFNIQKQSNKKRRNELITEWLVQLCTSRLTRWDGAFELTNQISHYVYSKNPKSTAYNKYITSEQKARLQNILFSCDKLRDGELLLIQFVPNDQREKLIKHLVDCASRASKWELHDIMYKIVENKPNKDLERLLHKIFSDSNYYHDRRDEQKIKLLIEEFNDIALSK